MVSLSMIFLEKRISLTGVSGVSVFTHTKNTKNIYVDAHIIILYLQLTL